MPHLSFATSRDGPALEVLIGADGARTAALHQAGAPIPRPLQVRALIDTGSDVTAVAPRVLQQVGAVLLTSVPGLTASGPVSAQLFEVSLNVFGPAGAAGPMFVKSTLVVTELAAALPNIEVLLGQDVLAECLFLLDGPRGHFLLGF
ncbi:MAG: retroviral-like aspartic protease family protein [Gemmataceae bacterium]|nr:retroviral-like aspartic protease family protein [Gemmataceae bacterium]